MREVFIPAKPLPIFTPNIHERYIRYAENFQPIPEVVLETKSKRRVEEFLRERREISERFPGLLEDEELEVVQEGKTYKVIRHITSFLEAVERGKVRDESGLKLSPTQVAGEPPAGGFLQEVAKYLVGERGYEGYEWAKRRGVLGYGRGVVVKICGDHDRELSKYHNTWAVITKVIDAYHYRVVLEGFPIKRLIIRDFDVKGIVGDVLNDYIGIGKERHGREVVPLIERALAGKVPVVPHPIRWPRPPIAQATASIWIDYGSFNKTNVIRAINKQVRRIKVIERYRERGLFYCDADYRYVKGEAVLWLKLFWKLLQIIEGLERGEDAYRIPLWDKRSVKQQREGLCHKGIPHIVRDDGFLIPRSLLLKYGLL